MAININDLLTKSVQIQESAEYGNIDSLSKFAINLESVDSNLTISDSDMGNIRAALGAGMAANTVLEARYSTR